MSTDNLSFSENNQKLLNEEKDRDIDNNNIYSNKKSSIIVDENNNEILETIESKITTKNLDNESFTMQISTTTRIKILNIKK